MPPLEARPYKQDEQIEQLYNDRVAEVSRVMKAMVSAEGEVSARAAYKVDGQEDGYTGAQVEKDDGDVLLVTIPLDEDKQPVKGEIGHAQLSIDPDGELKFNRALKLRDEDKLRLLGDAIVTLKLIGYEGRKSES